MLAGLRTAGDAVLRRSPVQPVFHWRASRELAVLAYHEVRDPEAFDAQLRYLRRRRHPVTLSSVVRAIEGGTPLPRGATLVTFDDGHRDLLDVAMPLLVGYGIPAAAFVVAGLVGTDVPHWWTEVRELVARGGSAHRTEGMRPEDAVRALKTVPDAERLAAIQELRLNAPDPSVTVAQLTADELLRMESSGIEVANHSLTHPCLSRCTDEKIRDEIEGSHAILTRLLGHEPSAFAYPDGDRDARVTGVVREVGYAAGFLFDHRLSASSPPDTLNVSRLRVDAHARVDRLRIIVSGLHPFIHRLRGGS